MKKYIAIFFSILSAYIGWHTFRITSLVRTSEKLAQDFVPFSRIVDKALLHILIIGDSSGVGIGASHPERTIAGLLGKKYENATIINTAVNGAKTRDAFRQLEEVPGFFDLIIILVGGNDVVHFTPYAQLSEDLKTLLKLARHKGKHVLLSTTGDLGDVLIFPTPIRWMLSHRSHHVHRILRKHFATAPHTIHFADPFRDGVVDPFALHPDKYFAPDLFHPNDAGYADWFNLIAHELDHVRLKN